MDPAAAGDAIYKFLLSRQEEIICKGADAANSFEIIYDIAGLVVAREDKPDPSGSVSS